MENIDEVYSFAAAIIDKAGKFAKAQFELAGKDGPTVIATKENYADLLTETDGAVEKMIIELIAQHYPKHRFIGEESVSGGKKIEFTDESTWIVDPIDGTCNFAHRMRYFNISIAYCENKEPLIGLIYNIPQDHLYSAIKGRGAYCNGKPISHTGCQELEKSLLICEFGSQRDPGFVQFKLDNMTSLLPKCHGLRALGSAALNVCMVASGQADGYVEHGIHIWDIAAGVVIAGEAGAVVLDTQGGPVQLRSRRIVIAATQQLASQILANINPVYAGIELD